MDINEISISNRIYSSEKVYKSFVGDINCFKIKPFTIILSKANANVKSYDGGATKWMYFWI